MKKSKIILSMFLVLVLLASSAMSGVGTVSADAGVTFAGLPSEPHEFNEFTGETDPVVVAPDFEVTGLEDESLSDGYLQFDLEGGSTSTEKLYLDITKNITLADGRVVSSDGEYIYIDAVVVGKVNSTYDGDGNPLRVDLSIPLNNGDFEEVGTDGNIPG